MATLAPGSLTSYNVAPGQSLADLDLKKKMALQLMMQGTSTEPVQHWTQGLARIAQGLIGGYGIGEAQREDEAEKESGRKLISALMPGSVAANSTMPSTSVAPVQSTPTDTTPRGIRNNNPLNIEAGQFTQSQPGFAGSDGRFAKFASMDEGVGAANALLDTYRDKHGLNTVRGIIGRWAPAGETGNNTAGYVASVAGRLGVDPDQPLTPEQRQPLISAMAQFENGRPLPVGSSVPVGGAPSAQPSVGGPVGAAPDQMRGGLGDARRMQIITALMQNKYTAPLGQQMMLKETEREANRTRQLTTREERAAAGIPPTDTRPYQIDANGKVSTADSSPTINMQANTTGETAYSKGKAEDALNLERSADKTMLERQRLDVFKGLVSDFKTGKLAPAQATIGAWGDALGISPETMKKFGLPENAAINGQLIESLSNELTLGMIGGKGGEGGMPANNFSDADRKFLQNTVPGLARMQGGNMVLAEIKQRSLDRQLDKIAMWDDYRSQGKKFEDFERDWRAKVRSEPSLFADIPDMVRGLSNQPNASGFAPPNQNTPKTDPLGIR